MACFVFHFFSLHDYVIMISQHTHIQFRRSLCYQRHKWHNYEAWTSLSVSVCAYLCVAVCVHHQPSATGDTVLHPQRWWHDKCVTVAVWVVKSHTTAVRWATLLTDSTQWMNYTWLKPQLTARTADIKAKWQLWHITVLMYLMCSCSSKCELST